MMGITEDRTDPRLTHGVDDKPTEMAEVYLVMSEEERKKGLVRPFRNKYVHVGPAGPKYELRSLTNEEHKRYLAQNYVAYESYPEDEGILGRFWKQEQLDAVGKGCGTLTVMGDALSETYAADPTYYGATWCVGCKMHRPVGEFTWDADGSRVGS
jgi:hypothetical protein